MLGCLPSGKFFLSILLRRNVLMFTDYSCLSVLALLMIIWSSNLRDFLCASLYYSIYSFRRCAIQEVKATEIWHYLRKEKFNSNESFSEMSKFSSEIALFNKVSDSFSCLPIQGKHMGEFTHIWSIIFSSSTLDLLLLLCTLFMIN